jgi:hypothetical protein
MLTDRVLPARGEKQVYATQFMSDEAGVRRPSPTIDRPGVEARRAVVGPPTLVEDGKRMEDTHAEKVELTPAEPD